MQLDNSCRLRIDPFEVVERFVQSQDVVVRRAGGQWEIVQFDSFEFAAVTDTLLPPCVIYEDSPHGLGGRYKEMAAAVPARRLIASHQS